MDRKETEEALEEARRGGLKRFDSVEALFADLNELLAGCFRPHSVDDLEHLAVLLDGASR